MKKVLILGGGFAGVYAALELEKRLGKSPDVQIVEEEETPDEAEALRRVQEMLGAKPVEG